MPARRARFVDSFLPGLLSFFAGRDRDTALATARLIASSHFNIIEACHGRSDHNNEQALFFSLQSKGLNTLHQTQSVSLLKTLYFQVSHWFNASFVSHVLPPRATRDSCKCGGVPIAPAM